MFGAAILFQNSARHDERSIQPSIVAMRYAENRNEWDMPNLPANDYVEIRDGKTCVTGTRIGLDVFIYAYRRGKTPEALLEAFPSIGSLAKVHGVTDFLLRYPQFVEAYLQEQEAAWDKFRKEHPIPDEMADRLRLTREELSRRSA
jgi:uncharacterized protein (DUF433 family)